MTDFALSSYLAAERESVEPALEDVVSWLESDLPPDVGAAIRHGVMGGGKRLRPILCATAYRACSKEDPVPVNGAVYALAAALELIHCYSLMHDDLPCMDDAELRRGQATTHVAHGEAATARAGAALIPAAADSGLALKVPLWRARVWVGRGGRGRARAHAGRGCRRDGRRAVARLGG